MTGAHTDHTGMLRWYPPEWRNRYGDEFLTLLEDTYAGAPVPMSVRLSTARAGLAERLRGVGFIGDSGGPEGRLRGASLMVLCAWAFFVLAGAEFAKYAEHWDRVTPAGDRALPSAAYDTVQVAAFVGTLIVALGAACVLPTFARSIRRQGWAPFSRPLRALLITSTLAVATAAGIILWAHHLGPTRRDGGWLPFRIIGTTWVVMVIIAVATGTGAIIGITARLGFSRPVTRALAALALSMTLTLVVVFAGVVAWWASLAASAPWFFGSGAIGSGGSTAPPAMIVCGAVMLVGLALALCGAGRVLRNLGGSPSGHRGPVTTG